MKLMDIQDSDESGESWAVWKDRSVWGAVTRGMTSADVCFFLPRATRSKCKNKSLFPSLKFLFSFFSEIVASIIPEKTKEQNQGWTAQICICRKLANCQSYSKSRWNISNIIFLIWYSYRQINRVTSTGGFFIPLSGLRIKSKFP